VVQDHFTYQVLLIPLLELWGTSISELSA